MKKSCIIVLLAALAFNQVGSYFVLRCMQYRIKEQVMEKIFADINISDTEAICLTGNEQQIEWEEEGKEFSYMGDMYDVVRADTIDKKIMLYCLNDEQENQLLQKYYAAEKHANETKKPKSVNTFLTLYLEAESCCDTFSQSENKNTFPVFIPQLSPGANSILSPPPKA